MIYFLQIATASNRCEFRRAILHDYEICVILGKNELSEPLVRFGTPISVGKVETHIRSS